MKMSDLLAALRAFQEAHPGVDPEITLRPTTLGIAKVTGVVAQVPYCALGSMTTPRLELETGASK